MPTFSADFSIRECGSHVVVALRGKLGIADVAAALAAVSKPGIVVDLAVLDFIDCSGVAALDARKSCSTCQCGITYP